MCVCVLPSTLTSFQVSTGKTNTVNLAYVPATGLHTPVPWSTKLNVTVASNKPVLSRRLDLRSGSEKPAEIQQRSFSAGVGEGRGRKWRVRDFRGGGKHPQPLGTCFDNVTLPGKFHRCYFLFILHVDCNRPCENIRRPNDVRFRHGPGRCVLREIRLVRYAT